MKKSLAYLPEDKRQTIRQITQDIVEFLPGMVEMVILYGSYARNTYVDYDQRIEFGIPTVFMSDYDILIVTNDAFSTTAYRKGINMVLDKYYEGRPVPVTPRIQFIDEGIRQFNKALKRGLYFYTDIKKEGIMLYDTGRYKLARRKKLNYREIWENAKMFYESKFETAEDFLEHAKFDYNRKKYKMASFHLHQAIEHFYLAVILTYTLYTEKQHNLDILRGLAKRHSLEMCKPFPGDSVEEKDLFDILIKAYVQARYNPNFEVNQEFIEKVIPRVELLRDITKKICVDKINEYLSMI